MATIQEGIRRARANGIDDMAIAAYLAEQPEVGDKVRQALADPNVTAQNIVDYLSETKEFRMGEQSSTQERALGTALQGPTLGFGDKLAAAAAALPVAAAQDIPVSDAYQKALDYAQGQTTSFRKERPITSTALQAGAALPLAALPVGAAAPGMGIMGRTAAAAGTGATMGGLQAAGESRFSLTSPEFMQEVGRGAGYGAAFGGGMQSAMPILGMAASPVRQVTSRLPGRAGEGFAENYAQQKVAESLLRGMPEGPGMQPLTQAQAKFRAMGPEARMADVSQPSRDLLDIAATLPGRTGQAVERAIRERQIGAAGRLQTGAEQALGREAANLRSTVDDLISARELASKPYYRVTDRASVTVDDELKQLLDRTQDAQAKAIKFERLDTGKTVDLSGLQVGDTVPFRMLDSLKKALDDASSAALRAGEGNERRLYSRAASDLVNKLIQVSPQVAGKSAYQQALIGYAGPSRMLDAVELGRQAFKANVDDIADEMTRMTSGELELFRLGAARALREKAGTEAGRTQLLKFWKEPNTQDRLRQVFGNNYRQFAATLLREGKLKPFESVGRGSQTARRQAGMADVDVSPLATAVEVGAAAKTGMVTPNVVQQFVNQLGRVRVPEPVRNEIGRILLSRDPADFDRLRQVMQQLNATQRRMVVSSGLLGGQAGQYFLD